ncbi:MAG: SagB/ThcOx family dehydrogenase [Thiobacillaceae bacterium]
MTRRIPLPEFCVQAVLTYEELLWRRRSVRAFAPRPLTLQHCAQLLWAAQGVSDPAGLRTAPLAGALYPLEPFLVVGQVTGLDAAVYRYEPTGHLLAVHLAGDQRTALAAAAHGQSWVAQGAVVLAIAAAYQRCARKYGERAARYVPLEAGHVAQNVCVECTALGLGTAPIGAIDDDTVRRVLRLLAGLDPLYLLPVGHPT